MEEEAKKILLCLLKNIKFRADLTSNESADEVEIKKEALKRVKKSRKGIVESSKREANFFFPFLLGKRIKLNESDLKKCGIKFNLETDNLIEIFKEKKILKAFMSQKSEKLYELVLHDKFNENYYRFRSALEIKEKKKPKEKTMFKVAPGTSWRNITIKFQSEFILKIIINKKEFESNYEKMGFADERMQQDYRAKAKASWNFLRLLAIKDGGFPFKNLSLKDRAKYKKQKQELSRILMKFFEINDDPFEKYDKRSDEFRIKINLVPDSEFRDDYLDKIKGLEDEKWGIQEISL